MSRESFSNPALSQNRMNKNMSSTPPVPTSTSYGNLGDSLGAFNKTSPNTSIPQPQGGKIGQDPYAENDPFKFSQAIDAMRGKLSQNDTLLKQKQLMLQHLYNRPLTPEEKKGLSPSQLRAIDSNNQQLSDMEIRLINDQINGRVNSLDNSIKYLTEGYQSEIEQQQTQYNNALNNLTALAAKYGPQTGDYLMSVYGTDYIQKLYGMGIDVRNIGNTPVDPELASQNKKDMLELAKSYISAGDTTTAMQILQKANIVDLTGGVNMQSQASGFTLPYNDQTKTYVDSGAGTVISDQNGNQVIQFTDPAKGKEAVNNFLTTASLSNTSIDRALKAYSGGQYGAEIAPELDPTMRTSRLHPEQMSYLLSQIQQQGLSQGVNAEMTSGMNPQALAGVDPATAAQVKAISTYRQAPIARYSAKGGRIMGLVEQYNPNYDQTQYQVKQQMRKSVTSGNIANVTVSANTLISHLSRLKDDFEKLGNTSIEGYNKIKNYASDKIGDQQTQEALGSIQTEADAVAGEMAKIYKNSVASGASPSTQEIDDWRANINENMSPTKFNAAVNKGIELMTDKINVVNQQYKSAMDTTQDYQFFQPETLHILKNKFPDVYKILGLDSYGTGSSASMTPSGNSFSF